MKVVIAVRHGESYKNLKDIYGGEGSGLTEEGIRQVISVAENLSKVLNTFHLPVRVFRSCDRIQVKETSEMIVKRLGAKVVETDAEFKPIRLGVLDGMNGEQQRKLYPEVSSANEKWRKGEGDIKEGLAEGAQPAIEYYNQIKGFIDGLPDNGVYILVGTRSDVICLKNIFSNQSPEQDMCYQYYDIDYVQTEILMEHKGRQQVIKMSKMLTGLSRPGPKKGDIDFK